MHGAALSPLTLRGRYRSAPHAAEKPWLWPERTEVGSLKPDDALQARLYEAFFQSFWNEPWFAGALIWKWYPEANRPMHAIDFTPQGKPAEAVLRRWFRG